jgi:hypothetical protein
VEVIRGLFITKPTFIVGIAAIVDAVIRVYDDAN